jgi:hypothetical protein
MENISKIPSAKNVLKMQSQIMSDYIMNPYQDQLNTPILFITFRRPDTTRRVFERIKQAQPKKLYIAQNFPGSDNAEEIKKWNDVRAIIENIDWDCHVKKLYREYYLDAKTSISTAINWFFQQEEEGIILEDDCLPHPTFFRFCEELLEKYRDDERIAMISGDNFQFGNKRTEYSYYFSRYTHIWGWASWRRAWKNYDANIASWPEIRDGVWLHDLLGDQKSVRYWEIIFEDVYNGKIDTWDFQWAFSCWIQNALTILPNVNLVSNIGFGKDAAHTKNKCKLADMETKFMIFPISHPSYILRDSVSDHFTEKMQFSGQSLLSRVLNKAKKIIKKQEI